MPTINKISDLSYNYGKDTTITLSGIICDDYTVLPKLECNVILFNCEKIAVFCNNIIEIDSSHDCEFNAQSIEMITDCTECEFNTHFIKSIDDCTLCVFNVDDIISIDGCKKCQFNYSKNKTVKSKTENIKECELNVYQSKDSKFKCSRTNTTYDNMGNSITVIV